MLSSKDIKNIVINTDNRTDLEQDPNVFPLSVSPSTSGYGEHDDLGGGGGARDQPITPQEYGMYNA